MSGKQAIRRIVNGLRGNLEGVLQVGVNTCTHCAKEFNGRLDSLGLCAACAGVIPWIEEILCETCGRHKSCTDCSRREHTYFVYNRSAVHYDKVMKEWLARYKFRGDEKLRMLMGQMLNRAYMKLADQLPLGESKPLCITYVPLSDQRLSERGFNQAQQLAVEIGARNRVPVVPLLDRVRHTDKQSFKGRYERLEHLSGAYRINSQGLCELEELIGLQEGVQFKQAISKVQFKLNASSTHGQASLPANIIIVDDVYTTGSTLNECAKIISERCNVNIYGLTWAR